MGAVTSAAGASTEKIVHTRAFRTRRFLNWFPLGFAYAVLVMGRYNLTVAKTSLSSQAKLMTNEDFGLIFGVGTLVYAFSFLMNGPLVDRFGGRKGMLYTMTGSAFANLAMAFYLHHVLASGNAADAPLRLVFSVLYGVNMYFQSCGAVSILKVNAHWFHVSERGGFSGIFGTMISGGLFLAFTVNGWLLDAAQAMFGAPAPWIVFAAPAALLLTFVAIEGALLRDRPSDAGHDNFDTGDASSGDTNEAPLRPLELYKRLLTNPILLTVAAIEFCTGVLRNGVMTWFPIYAKEVWALPTHHVLMYGEWSNLPLLGVMFAVAGVSFFLSSRAKGGRRGVLAVLGALAFLAPFVQGGWGGLLFIAGVTGSNVAGWVSDLFFQSRRGPAAAGLYAFLAVCAVGMVFALAPPTNEVASADAKTGLVPGDRVVEFAGKPVHGWADVRAAVACVKPQQCVGSGWDAEKCVCTARLPPDPTPAEGAIATIPVRVERGGETIDVAVPDPAAVQRAGDARKLGARPVIPLSPYWLGAIVFLVSLCVIGTHGLLSGTATIDFGGRKAAATAGGMIDGFVYLGTGFQSICLGFLTSKSFAYWPPFLLPFSMIGFALCLRIWNAKPQPKTGAAPSSKAEAA